MPEPTLERNERIRDMYISGESMERCGKEFGITAQAIFYLLKKHFPEVPRRKSYMRKHRPPAPYDVSPDIVAYTAGLFDGEGCVNFCRGGRSRSLVVRTFIVNTNRDVLEFVQGHFGGKIYEMPHVNPQWKIAYSLVFANRHAVRFLDAIDPWLRIKGNQAAIAFAWEYLRDNDSPENVESYELIRRQLAWLNKKGLHGDSEPMQAVLDGIGGRHVSH